MVITAIVVLHSVALNLVYAGDQTSKNHTVEIRDLGFKPNELEVSPGDTITWINYDIVPHTATSDDESWDSGLIAQDGKWQSVVKEDMMTSYFCRYHPTMKATLKINKK